MHCTKSYIQIAQSFLVRRSITLTCRQESYFLQEIRQLLLFRFRRRWLLQSAQPENFLDHVKTHRLRCAWVELQVQRVPGQGLVIGPLKTEAGNRIIALGTSTLRKLSDHRVQQVQIRLEVRDTWNENGLIFLSSVGTPFDPRNLLKDFKIVLERAGLPDMRFHDIRHSSITLLLNEVGAPIKEIG